jgi:PAS domain-containing protein
MNRTTLFAIFLPLLAVCTGVFMTSAENPHQKFKGDDAAMMRWRMGELCTEEGVYFTGSGNCVNCHAPDPDGEALVDENGHTVSPVADWQATMMANSARDPFWQAKVAHEGLVNPEHRESIENVCTACHAPQGFHEAHLTGSVGQNGYTMADLAEDDLGLDGVGCAACHSIDDIGLAGRSNGDLPINPENVAWGGFENPWDGLMSGQTGFIPVYGEHMRNSEVCASCHSLYVHTQDLDGEETGQVYFEQTTYLEWVNSAFNAENVQCQGCHMPLVEGGAIAATQPNWLFPQRFGKHHLVGGNAFMLKLMRDNAVTLELSASPTQFDSTIARTERSLQNETAQLSLMQLPSNAGEWAFEVEVQNSAGHKFPSGYPSRMAFLEFVLTSSNGDTLFHSGKWSSQEGVFGRDATYEPHWSEITSEDQVQVYETVFGDVSGTPTQLLERASLLLKDNRVPPRGFYTNHVTYDTVRFGPMAELDIDFNHYRNADGSLGDEGSGTDRLVYRIADASGAASVEAHLRLHYVAVPARWVSGMFEYADQSEAIATFESMFNASDRTPVLMKAVSASGYMGYNEDVLDWRVAPNPVADGNMIRLIPPEGQSAEFVWLTDANGRVLREVPMLEAMNGYSVSDFSSGTYFARIQLVGGEFKTVRWVK